MCGIVGFVRTSSKYIGRLDDLMADLLFFDSVRGDHSTGIFYAKTEWNKGKKEVIHGYAKNAMPGWEFVNDEAFINAMKYPSNLLFCVGHNRAATRGAISVANAHPFKHGTITLVHNGSLRNHHSLTKELFQVDSEAVTHCLNDKGLKHLANEMEGAWSLVWHNAAEETLNFYRNEQRPMVFAICDDLIVFGSEEGILRAACDRNKIQIKKTYSSVVYNHIKFEFDIDKGHMSGIEEEEIKPEPKPVQVVYPKSSWYNAHEERYGYTPTVKSANSHERLGLGCPINAEVNVYNYPVQATRPHFGVGQDLIFCLLDHCHSKRSGYYEIDGEMMLLKHQHISIVGQATMLVVQAALNSKKMVRGKIKCLEHIGAGKLLIEVEHITVSEIDDPAYKFSVGELENETSVPAVQVQ